MIDKSRIIPTKLCINRQCLGTLNLPLPTTLLESPTTRVSKRNVESWRSVASWSSISSPVYSPTKLPNGMSTEARTPQPHQGSLAKI